MIRNCKDCKAEYNTFSSLQTRCPKCQYARTAKNKKPPKPMKQRGKKTITYEKWRDDVAIPYLIEKYGDWCSRCKKPRNVVGSLDVDHIKKRKMGGAPSLTMDIDNVRFLCRSCHQLRDSIVK